MGTDIRPEVSKRSPYWMPRDRYYELRHFCLQYHYWRCSRELMSDCIARPGEFGLGRPSGVSDPVSRCVILRERYGDSMNLVETAAKETGELGMYVFEGVTEGLSYEHLNAREQIPCGKEMYYKVYRRFFFILSELRK